MGERIRVLHVIKSLGRGGAETLLPESLRVHDRTKFEFHYVYFLPWKDQMVQEIIVSGGKVTCIPAGNNFALMLRARSLLRYIRMNKIQVVHAHLPWAGILARIVGKSTGIPVMYTEHNKQERYHFLTRWMNLVTINLLSELIAVSGDVELSVRQHKRHLSVPVRTILNGVNTEHFSPANFSGHDVRARLGIPFDAVVIGTVAVFRAQKRLDVWLNLASQILKRHQNVHFIIVGDGPLKDFLVQTADSLGMRDRVYFPGLELEVRPYLAAFDIFMMSSMFEGLPLALLEAMSMECAVVATDAGGVKEVITDGVDGTLCPVEKPEYIIELVSKFLLNASLRQQIGRQARQKVQSSFGLSSMVSKLEKDYIYWAGILG